MKYFICALEKISLGIPAEITERIIPVTRVQTAVYQTEDQTAFISLPVLLQHKDSATPHGVVFKPAASGNAIKIVLLTPRIDIDLEIPEEDIHALPEAFTGLFGYFRGAYFPGKESRSPASEGIVRDSVILILNTEKIMETMR